MPFVFFRLQLVAPSIQYPESQNIVLTAADQLSTKVKELSFIWAPSLSQPEQSTYFKDLEVQRQNLEKLLVELKVDIVDQERSSEVSILTIEDTLMHQLVTEILNNYKVIPFFYYYYILMYIYLEYYN